MAVLESLPTELLGHGVTPIVVVDGGTDDTAGVVEQAGHLAVRHEINRGQGDALRTGFALAIERKAAIVVTMDADGQHRPEELPRAARTGDRGRGRLRAGLAVPRCSTTTPAARATSASAASPGSSTWRAARGSPTARTASGRSAAMRSRRLRLEEPRFSACELIMESARQGLRMQRGLGAHPVADPR